MTTPLDALSKHQAGGQQQSRKRQASVMPGGLLNLTGDQWELGLCSKSPKSLAVSQKGIRLTPAAHPPLMGTH